MRYQGFVKYHNTLVTNQRGINFNDKMDAYKNANKIQYCNYYYLV